MAGPTPHDLSEADGRQPAWGLGEVAAGLVLSFIVAGWVFSAIAHGMGYSNEQLAKQDVPLSVAALGTAMLWIGFVGAPVWAARTKGRGVVADFGVRIRWIDVPVGIVAGVVTQFVIAPLVSLPVLWLSHKDFEDLGKPAKQLASHAHGAWGIALFTLIVAVGAPLAEELFYRGLMLRAIEKRFVMGWAIVGSSIIFGITHGEPLQTVALISAGLVFALLAVRAGRLGPSVVAHMTFNGVAVIQLVHAR
jgi:membrane protease YdiL (CAAX protease family)